MQDKKPKINDVVIIAEIITIDGMNEYHSMRKGYVSGLNNASITVKDGFNFIDFFFAPYDQLHLLDTQCQSIKLFLDKESYEREVLVNECIKLLKNEKLHTIKAVHSHLKRDRNGKV